VGKTQGTPSRNVPRKQPTSGNYINCVFVFLLFKQPYLPTFTYQHHNNTAQNQHSYSSTPASWPWLRRGISYWQGAAEGKVAQVYLLGNPIVWWLALAGLVLCLLAVLFYLLREKRGFRDLGDGDRTQYVPV
jgi:dolichyl-phosphate-mannose--protein O-mannosyl transferase